MTKFEELQAEHQRLLNQVEAKGNPAELLSAVDAYLERVRVDAQFVPAPRDRDQLRANLRFWASYVFDKTGTYPDTTLRPTTLTNEPSIIPPEALLQRWLRPAGVLAGGVIVLSVLILAVALISRGTDANVPLPTPVATTIAIAETRTATPALPTAVATTIATAESKTATPVPPTAIKRTLAPSILLIPAAQLTPKPTLLPQQELGVGGGGGDFPLLSAHAVQNGSSCANRSITLAFDRQQSLTSEDDSAIQVQFTRVGTGEQIISSTLNRHEAATIDVSMLGTQSNVSLLIQAEAQNLIFASVLVPFAADCTGNQVLVDYRLDQQTVSTLLPPLPANQNLDLNWFVLTWGPSPFDENWVAELKLQATGGDGHYVFWADNARLNGDQVVIQIPPCQLAQMTIGVTSGGERMRRNVMLMSPIFVCR